MKKNIRTKKIPKQKKAQVTMFVLVALFLVGAIVFFAWLKADDTSTVEEIECHVDTECVANECCNARLCVPENQAPECGLHTPNQFDDIQCDLGEKNYGDQKYFLGRATGPNNQGQGSCACVNNKCAPSFP